jgi:hypothetical protein
MATSKNTVKTNTRKTVKAAAAPALPIIAPVEAAAPAKVERAKAQIKNGIKAPLRAGKCKHVWEVCQTMYETTGKVPTLKELNAHEAMQGTNLTNNAIEFYRWRKFNGLNVK